MPGTEETLPFGPDVLVYKVGGKMFALMAPDEVPVTVNLKCDPDQALALRDRYEDVRPGYHMNKRHWNTVVLGGGVPDAELRRMLEHSYELVVASLPRARRETLSSRSAAAAARPRRTPRKNEWPGSRAGRGQPP